MTSLLLVLEYFPLLFDICRFFLFFLVAFVFVSLWFSGASILSVNTKKCVLHVLECSVQYSRLGQVSRLRSPLGMVALL